jgi:ParB/RepB/Spo0J family partition protein
MSTTVTSPETITLIDPARLHPAPDNVRRSLGKLDDLTRSIKGVGIVEPLLVTTHESLPDGDYLIVAGHRRHAAAIAAEVEHVPVIVRALTDAERIASAVVENVQREALNPVEEATAFLRLCELDFTIRRLARTVGRSEKHVRSRLALLELPDRAHELIEAGRLTLADAEVLLSAKDRPEVIEEILGDDATIHQGRIESAVRSATRRAEQAEARIALQAELVAAGIVVLDEGVTCTPLADLGIEEDVHRGETCHGVTIRSGYGDPQAIVVCTDRRRHSQRGDSEVKVDRSAVRTDPEQERTRERRRVAERRATFLSGTIGGRLSKPASTAFALRVLLDRANSNDCARACRSLGIESGTNQWGSSDWVAPLRAFADGSDTNLLRASVAIAAAIGEARIGAHGGYSGSAVDLLGYLGELGYELDPFEAAEIEAGRRNQNAPASAD